MTKITARNEEKAILEFTSKALSSSSLVWEADKHIRALANSSGVAGNDTTTTATCDSII